MDLILYTLQLRLRQAFHPRVNPWGLVGLIFFVLTAVAYGWMTGEAMDHAIMAQHVGKGKVLLLLLTAALTLVRTWFPTYMPLHSWIRSFSPVSRVQAYGMHLLQDLSGSYMLSMLAFIIVLVSTSTQLGFGYGINMLWVLLGSHLIRRTIQTIIENRIRLSVAEGIMLVLVLGSFLLVLLGLRNELSPSFALFLGLVNVWFFNLYTEAFTRVERKEFAFSSARLQKPISQQFATK